MLKGAHSAIGAEKWLRIESIAGSADMSEGGLVTFVVTYSRRL